MQALLARRLRAWCPRLLVTSSPAAYVAGGSFFADSAVSFVSYHFYNDLQNYSQLNSYVVAYEQARYHKPVQWGEYGFNQSWYHARNMAEIRNPLWSSAFSGSFGAGLFFWSWGITHHNWRGVPQGFLSFQALASFFATEDLACQPYQPLRTALVPERAAPRPCGPHGIGPPECLNPAQANRAWPDPYNDSTLVVPASLLPSDPRLEAFALHNAERVLGWVHQREEYWYNLPHNNELAQQTHFSHPDSLGRLPAGDQLQRYVSDLCGARLRVPGLRPLARYRLDWWQTLGTGGRGPAIRALSGLMRPAWRCCRCPTSLPRRGGQCSRLCL
ncbi:hypothetical protein [Hymenobacter sp. BRD67]|uniref:hypothetical protein n=1 Tax=Hymenobacter sp. BRD67 TaxID=2675877 RepID=UPI0015674396|nr:hypothetical protein [Hymenobacter sp. BRD67]QKG51531.1 hypothetical protein GKZ67_01655 [Hymenobacter sp. BRD67]